MWQLRIDDDVGLGGDGDNGSWFFSFREVRDEGCFWRWNDEGELACEGIDKVLFLGEGKK